MAGPELNRWEGFARENAEFYVLTNPSVDYGSPDGQGFFYESGVHVTEAALANVRDFLHGRGRALEFGCGLGRLTFPHAAHFDRISAVDIAPTMLRRLEAEAKARGIGNIETFLTEAPWDESPCDYAYSFLVFQHIEDFGQIAGSIARIARCLKTGGIAYLQFDTRPRSLHYRLRNRLPDFVLPRVWRKGIRRIRRSGEDVRALLEENALMVLRELDPDTELHCFVARKIDKTE